MKMGEAKSEKKDTLAGVADRRATAPKAGASGR